ncbi:hypothetical protein [Sphaerisporangium perillae]|uniref:hypothetical protein n=1 Tax=Sphaerisporangium perillae TaxID=2935860 RepID=UPI00200F7C3F|nr:hypothetical protein [Sphaerisporangium perillae]
MMTDANSFRRRAAGVALILAPALLLLSMIIDPTGESGQAEGLAYAAHPGAMSVAATLLHYCWVLLVPGVLGMLHLVRRRGVVLAHVAGVLSVLGLVNLSGLMLVDFFESAAYLRLPPEQAAALIDAAGMPAVIAGWQLPGMAGSLLGLVLAAFAVVRAGKAGWWLPAGTITGLAGFVAGAQSANLIPALAGPAVLVATFGAMGLSLIRMSDEEWASHPAASPSASAVPAL